MTTRRDFVHGRTATVTATAACIGAVPPAVADTSDPIFAAIAAHREAMRAWDDALTIVGELEGKRFARRETFFDDQPDAEEERAKEHADALDEIETDAQVALIETATTLPGTLAAIRYVLSYYNGTSEIFPGRTDELLDDESLLTFVENIGDVIEAAIAVQEGRRS